MIIIYNMFNCFNKKYKMQVFVQLAHFVDMTQSCWGGWSAIAEATSLETRVLKVWPWLCHAVQVAEQWQV